MTINPAFATSDESPKPPKKPRPTIRGEELDVFGICLFSCLIILFGCLMYFAPKEAEQTARNQASAAKAAAAHYYDLCIAGGETAKQCVFKTFDKTGIEVVP